jgi:ubiquinone/menaquinone biosynthesis C-methylase UbiE
MGWQATSFRSVPDGPSVARMNENHAKVCPSPEWAAFMQTDLLPALTRDVELGQRMLEIGPGPGATTDWLRHRVEELTVVEIEPAAAAALRARFPESNVEVIDGDASALAFADNSFDSAGSFTMLHHVPTAALQNQVLAEVLRVLKPGGTLVGSDSLPSNELHAFHVDDVYNPIDPTTLLARLQTIGYGAVTISVDYGLTFRARKPAVKG